MGMERQRRLGLVTIGQAPRDDIEAALRPCLGNTPVVQAGALDALDAAAIRALAPGAGDYPLVSRLRDGSQVIVGKRAVLPHLAAAVARAGDGAAAVAVLCSGTFPALADPTIRVVLPETALRERLASEFADGGRLGVIAPLPEQARQQAAKWGAVVADLVADCASPYGSDAEVRSAAARLVERSPSLVLLDCMGFVERHRTLVAGVVGVPVVSACSVLADALAAEVDG